MGQAEIPVLDPVLTDTPGFTNGVNGTHIFKFYHHQGPAQIKCKDNSEAGSVDNLGQHVMRSDEGPNTKVHSFPIFSSEDFVGHTWVNHP